MKAWWIIGLVSIAICSFNLRASIDLERGYFAAKFATKQMLFGWDGDIAFPEIADQHPMGACQSFAMTAFLEYLYYYQTGKIIEFSKKYTAYHLSKYLIDEFWDPTTQTYPERGFLNGTPFIGNAMPPFLIESVVTAGAIPEVYYAWGNLKSTTGPRSIDYELYEKIFHTEKPMYSRAEYLSYLDQAFLFPPPENIFFQYEMFNFANSKNEIKTIRSSNEMGNLLGLKKENFKILYNTQARPNFADPRITPEVIQQIFEWSYQETIRKSITTQKLTAKQITQEIKRSLDRRMVVPLVTEVWISSWFDQQVYRGGGGHLVVIVGYQEQDDKIYFKLRNSWGKEAPVGGYNYISADILEPNYMSVFLYNPE